MSVPRQDIGAGTSRRTLSCPPKRTGMTCGPTCRRCMLGRACLDTVSTRCPSGERSVEMYVWARSLLGKGPNISMSAALAPKSHKAATNLYLLLFGC